MPARPEWLLVKWQSWLFVCVFGAIKDGEKKQKGTNGDVKDKKGGRSVGRRLDHGRVTIMRREGRDGPQFTLEPGCRRKVVCVDVLCACACASVLVDSVAKEERKGKSRVYEPKRRKGYFTATLRSNSEECTVKSE